MSEFDQDALAMDDSLFDEFGADVSVQRGAAAAPILLRVVFTRGVERLGEYGQVIARVTTASFRNVEWVAKQGDIVALPEGGTRKVDVIDSDDGFVNVAVLHG